MSVSLPSRFDQELYHFNWSTEKVAHHFELKINPVVRVVVRQACEVSAD